MSKVAIIGNAAGGKSTLSQKLSKATGLPLYTVDKLQWQPGWKPAPRAELEKSLSAISHYDKWIIDGWGSWHLIEERFQKADTIIFVDHPLRIHLWWALKRQIKASLFPGSVDQPNGCDLSKVSWQMLKMIWKTHTGARPKLTKLISSFRKTKTVYHLCSPKQMNAFIHKNCH